MRDRVNIPSERRTGDMAEVAAPVRGSLLEVRLWANVELRQSQNANGVRVVGYASSYEQPYPIWGGAENGGFDETIARGAFSKSIREQDDVRFLVNHEGIPLARTKSGTLRLESDDYGLLVDAELDPGSPVVQSLRSAMERGDMDQMSFAFEVVKQEWSDNHRKRRLLEMRTSDVSVVTYPANAKTLALVSSSLPDLPAVASSSPPAPRAGMSLRMAQELWRH